MATNESAQVLADVADLRGGFAFKSKDYTDHGRFVLRTVNISEDGSITHEGAIYIPEGLAREYSRFELQPNDTLFVMVGATLGKVGLVKEKDLPALLNQNMWVVRVKDSKATHPRFLNYWLREKVKETLGWASGSARGFVRRDDYRNLPFSHLTYPEQQEIADILGTLDDKIELNRQMNRTLEAMARAIFKAWFVDFEPVKAKAEGANSFRGMPQAVFEQLPERFTETELGPVPDGWEVKPLDEIADFLNGLALQKYPATDSDDSLPIIKIAELRNGISAKSGRASRELPEKYIVHDGDFLFSWSGSLLAKFWTEGEGALNQHLFKVTSKTYPMWFLSQWVGYHLEAFQAIAASKATTMGHIQRSHLKEALTVCAPLDVLSTMSEVMAPLVNKTIAAELETRSLASIRNTLLPKLVSGEVRLDNAAKGAR